jgi:hypothetical protein
MENSGVEWALPVLFPPITLCFMKIPKNGLFSAHIGYILDKDDEFIRTLYNIFNESG